VVDVAPPFPLPPGRRLHLPGRGTTFVREVEGPPGAPTLLLLHGWTATADLNWATTYAPLGERFRVVAMDHRGHGRGIRSLRPFRLEDCADDAAAVCAALGIESVVPVGYSMGGPVAQLMWSRHRDLVVGLVLCATAGRFADSSPRTRLFQASMLGASAAARLSPPGLQGRFVTEWLRRRVMAGPYQGWAVAELGRGDPASLLQAGAALSRYDGATWSHTIDVPAAVVQTELDTVVPPHLQLALCRSIPGCTLHPVPGDHGVVFSRPSVFVPVLVEACSEVARRAAVLASRCG
jgi:3-oxoadipate enol-lactonase